MKTFIDEERIGCSTLEDIKRVILETMYGSANQYFQVEEPLLAEYGSSLYANLENCQGKQTCPELFSYSFAHTALKYLYIMFVYKWSCACAIFMTILSLVVELSALELVNCTELLLSRAFLLQFCMYCSEIYT